MAGRKVNMFVSLGLLAFVASMLVRLYAHGTHDFIVGLLMGMAVVFLISGVVRRS